MKPGAAMLAPIGLIPISRRHPLIAHAWFLKACVKRLLEFRAMLA